MELDQALTLLKEFGQTKKLQQGAINLVETLVKNNVPVNQADTFCQDHFMSANIATYYKEFFDYVASLKKEKEETPTSTNEYVDGLVILKSIDSTLKEILECLKNE